MLKVLTIIGCAFLVFLGFAMFLWIAGYERGVKDTEERWSDAVGRRVDRGSDIL